MYEKYENIVNSLRYCVENDCSPKCPRAGIGKGCISGLKREAADVIEELSKPRWISVEERRAEIPCICCDANGNMPFIPKGIVTIKDDQGLWQIDAGLADPSLHQSRLKPVLGYQNRITYWMPLPQPPKEDGRMEKEAGQDARDSP